MVVGLKLFLTSYILKTERNEKRINARKSLGISKEAIVILFLGRLSFHGKSHPLAIYKSISMITKDIDDKEIILLECGTFANKVTEGLYNQIICSFSNLIVKRVGGINQASEKSKIDCLNAANIFISLSDNIQETFGLTVIEAMAAELPCIVSDWNGYKDLVKDEENGYLIPTKYAVQSNEAFNKVDADYKTERINFDYMIGMKSMKTVTKSTVVIEKRQTGSVAESAALAFFKGPAKLLEPRKISDDGLAVCAIAEGENS